jgi:hypothetical protein
VKGKVMGTLKVMSIISLVITAMSLICILAFQTSDTNAAIGWGIIMCVWCIAYSIVGLVKSLSKFNSAVTEQRIKEMAEQLVKETQKS